MKDRLTGSKFLSIYTMFPPGFLHNHAPGQVSGVRGQVSGVRYQGSGGLPVAPPFQGGARGGCRVCLHAQPQLRPSLSASGSHSPVGKGPGVRGFRLPLLFKEGRGVVAGFVCTHNPNSALRQALRAPIPQWGRGWGLGASGCPSFSRRGEGWLPGLNPKKPHPISP